MMNDLVNKILIGYRDPIAEAIKKEINTKGATTHDNYS